MAHFARIDDNNIVTQVVVVDNSLEHRGEEYLSQHMGLGGRWIQTSYNHNFRKQFAGVGFSYNEEADVFIQPKPHSDWKLDENFDWIPPFKTIESEVTGSSTIDIVGSL